MCYAEYTVIQVNKINRGFVHLDGMSFRPGFFVPARGGGLHTRRVCAGPGAPFPRRGEGGGRGAKKPQTGRKKPPTMDIPGGTGPKSARWAASAKRTRQDHSSTSVRYCQGPLSRESGKQCGHIDRIVPLTGSGRCARPLSFAPVGGESRQRRPYGPPPPTGAQGARDGEAGPRPTGPGRGEGEPGRRRERKARPEEGQARPTRHRAGRRAPEGGRSASRRETPSQASRRGPGRGRADARRRRPPGEPRAGRRAGPPRR